MKRAYYLMVPAAFLLILANALYGHAVFSATHPENIAKFAIYIHPGEGTSSYPSNLILDVAEVWTGPLPEGGAVHNANEADREGLPRTELWHDYSACAVDWDPDLYRYLIDHTRNMLDFGTTYDHPYAPVYQKAVAPPTNSKGYWQMIPLCRDGQYTYSIRSEDPGLSLRAYMVPDSPESGPLDAYPGCTSTDFSAVTASCDVPPGSALLVWVPDTLTRAVTKITVSLSG